MNNIQLARQRATQSIEKCNTLLQETLEFVDQQCPSNAQCPKFIKDEFGNIVPVTLFTQLPKCETAACTLQQAIEQNNQHLNKLLQMQDVQEIDRLATSVDKICTRQTQAIQEMVKNGLLKEKKKTPWTIFWWLLGIIIFGIIITGVILLRQKNKT